MAGTFHRGELAVQERAGVRAQAGKIGGSIHAEIPPAAHGFLREQRLAVAASVSQNGRVWASLLTGPHGFLEPVDERRLRIHARAPAGDPLAENLRDGADVGFLVIDLANRKRLRLNGRVELRADDFDVVTREVFGNCPKYIQARVIEDDVESPEGGGTVQRGARLDDSQSEWIRRADTFFIATRHAEAGADASHRGGNPGFIQVIDGARLAWPDYSGNRMFQTLGNLHADPRAGLLFVDFRRGRTLQLAGSAVVDWRPTRARAFPGAERVVDFAIDDVVEIDGANGLAFRFLGRSPFNPS